MAMKLPDEIELLGRARCAYCGGSLSHQNVVVVRRWKRDSPNSKTATGTETWHNGCFYQQQKDHAEDRALEVLSTALTGAWRT